jgi:hypothetical protein
MGDESDSSVQTDISTRRMRLSNAADGIELGAIQYQLLIFNDTRGDVTLVTPFQPEM